MGYAEAADMLRRSARFTADPALRGPRLLEAGLIAMVAGRPEVARECLDQVIGEDQPPALVSAARVALARLQMMDGNGRLARDLLVGEAELLGPSDGPAAALMLADAAHASGMTGDAVRALELARLAEARLGEGAPHAEAVQVALIRVTCALLAGEPGAAELLERTPPPMEALSGGDPLAWPRVVVFVASLIWCDRFGDADALTESLIGTGRALSAPSMLPYPLASRANLRELTGDWEGAYVNAREAIELADEIGQHAVGAFARSVLAHLLAARGEEVECRALAAAALESVPSGDASAVIRSYVHALFGLLNLGLRRLDSALVALEAADEIARTAGVRSHGAFPYLPDLVETAVLAGRDDLAARGLARIEEQAPLGFARTLGAIERCRGLVAGDADEAIAHLRRAVDHEGAAGVPFERARSQLLLGERLQRARRRREAQEALAGALRTFEVLGASPWAERARTGLGTLGARPRARHSPATRDLTAQELQVARAAAEGLSNREIAAQLFLSVKTVEFHLRNAFAKLDVRSRTELAGRMLGGPTPEPGP